MLTSRVGAMVLHLNLYFVLSISRSITGSSVDIATFLFASPKLKIEETQTCLSNTKTP